jgi:hypothetical protein
MDGETSVLSSPDAKASVRVIQILGRFGDISDEALAEGVKTAGFASRPTHVKVGDFVGLQAADPKAAHTHHAWWVCAGRLAIFAEFRSSSPQYPVAVAAEILSSLRLDRTAVDSHPLETDIAGAAGRVSGTVYGYILRYRYAVVFLVLAALLVLLRGG